MTQNNDITNQNPKKGRGFKFGAALLSLTLVAAACSSDATVSEAPTTTGAPETTVVESPPTTAEAPVESTTAPTSPVVTSPTDDDSPNNDDERDEGQVAEISVDDVLADVGASGFVGTVLVQNADGEFAASFGSADRTADLDHDVDTIFDVGSITKQFTAAAILRLEMDGQLSVDDTIGQYVDGLTPIQNEITLHQLLTHTGGLIPAIGADDEAIALPAYIARIADTPLDASPGDRYQYSNVGYSLLGAVIEAVTADSYEVYLRDALFEPAGMFETGYVLPDWTDDTIAVGYIGEHDFGRPNERPWDVDGPWWNLRGNGGILSSMPDMLLWDQALRGDQILDADAKEKMYAPHVQVDSDGEGFYGYGWEVFPLTDGSTLITHAGGNNIFFADFLRLVDSDTTIVLATNETNPAVFELGGHLLGQFLGGGGICEINPPSIEATAAFDLIADYPDTPAGAAIAAWVDVVLSGSSNDPAALLKYVEESVGQSFLDEFGVEALVGLLQSLQASFDGFSVDRIYQQDDMTFHVGVVDVQGNQETFSARIGAAPESRVECTGFSTN